jgi:hypothetical protein
MAVLVEHGGHGGDVAAPLAMEIVDNYFQTVAPADREAPRLGTQRRRAPKPAATPAKPAAAPAAGEAPAAPAATPAAPAAAPAEEAQP